MSSAETRTGRSLASVQERRMAMLAHLACWFSLLPLVGLYVTAAIYRRARQRSPWVAQQALQAIIYQTLAFNLLLPALTILLVVAALAWRGSHTGGALALAVALTALPLFLLHYLAQGCWATHAARAIGRGEEYRYPWLGRLIGAPAATADQGTAAGPGASPYAGVDVNCP